MEQVSQVAKRLLRFFYIADPKETSFQHEDQVPNYLVEAFPLFISLMFIEHLVLKKKRGKWLPVADSITSIACGTFMEIYHLMTRGIQVTAYLYIYKNYRLAELPWDSTWTWIGAAVLLDFGYYWGHRATHEVNLFWSQHQVHHSSEEYNLTTALRQALFQDWCTLFAFAPLALVFPPSHFIVHYQINLLYQFWIHTEVIVDLGPLEWIFNTPSHHRVHHGATKYCIDKNYAGVLIIWDRIFGTFEKERRDEPMVYGLIDQVDSFNPLYLQLFYLGKVYDKFRSVSGFKNKLKALFYGPGWFPGTPRLGDPDGLAETIVRDKFSKSTTNRTKIYAAIHFLILSQAFELLAANQQKLDPLVFYASCAYLLLSFSSLGLLLNNSRWACWFEVVRCLLFLGFSTQPPFIAESPPSRAVLIILRVFYLYSALISQSSCIQSFSVYYKDKSN